MTEINFIIITLCVGLIFAFHAITKKIKDQERDRQLNEGREGLRRLKVDTLSQKPKQNHFEDDVIEVESLQQVKPLSQKEREELIENMGTQWMRPYTEKIIKEKLRKNMKKFLEEKNNSQIL